MRAALTALTLASLAACAHAPFAAPSIVEMQQSSDWANEEGPVLAAAMAKSVAQAARRDGRAGTLAQLGEAGYECIFGEGHEDYPEPAAVCTRSFASRACQMDWEVVLTTDPANPGKVETHDESFRRDCVGLGRDWPEPIKSAIDDQLAPGPELPAASN